jgi:hypothetical protein
MEQELKTTAAISRIGEAAVAKGTLRYLEHLKSLTLIRHIIPIIISTQQHRGANLALLVKPKGDTYFEEKVEVLKNNIGNHLYSLKVINEDFSRFIPAEKVANLELEWCTIRDWAGGPELENFNLHNHFIEQLIKLIVSITERADYFSLYLPGDKNADTSNLFNTVKKNSNDKLLIQYVLHETLEFIELIAKFRGLSTHALAMNSCDDTDCHSVKFLITQLNQKKEKFRRIPDFLKPYIVSDFSSIIEFQVQDVRIVQLIKVIEDKVIFKEGRDIDQHEFFDMVTNIINSLTEIVSQGIIYIQTKINKQLDLMCTYTKL